MNKTIIHNAPIDETDNINNFEIGCPVFITGDVYKFENNNYISTTDSTNCIPSVKSSGIYKDVKKYPTHPCNSLLRMN